MSWSPAPLRTALVAAAAVLLGLVATLVVVDLPGRILVGLAAAGLAVDAVRDVVVRPRLAAGPEGVEVRTWGGRQRLGWAGLRARVRTTKRLGVLTRTLEIDVDPSFDEDGVLVVLGRRDLGAPVEEVARRLRGLDPLGVDRPGERRTRGPLD